LPAISSAGTAPSSGVARPAIARLEVVLSHVRSQGYCVIEGECLRGQNKDASAPPTQRAHELMRFLTDPAVSAIIPPWGGELAIELLRPIDFEALRSVSPKWLLGYSDLSAPCSYRSRSSPAGQLHPGTVGRLTVGRSHPPVVRRVAEDDLTEEGRHQIYARP